MKTLAFLLAGIFSLGLTAQEIPALETYSLKNGLKVYLMKYGKIEAMNFSVIINSGKKNEAPGQQGYNSIVANLVLAGNKKYTEDQQNDKAFAIGATISKSASFDRTTIETSFLSKDAATGIDLMSAAILQPLFDKEKVVQYLSYLTDYNNPAKLNISQMTSVYSNLSIYGMQNPLGRSHTKEQLQQITSEKLMEFYKFNYTPKNARIIVCGNFNSDEIKKLIESNFGSWQSAYGEINGVSLETPSIKKKEVAFANRTAATQCALQWNKIAPSLKDKDVLAFKIANQLFNQKLFIEIREKGGKTYGIYSSHVTSQFSNLINIACSVRSNELLNTIELFDKTLQNFSQANFTKEEFDNEITKYKTSIMRMEYPSDVSSFYNPLIYDFEKRKNALQDADKITMDDVQKAVKKYFTPGIYKLVISGDEKVVASQLAKIPDLKKYSPADLVYKQEN
jgi:predicted Zn-dependent peptidase